MGYTLYPNSVLALLWQYLRGTVHGKEVYIVPLCLVITQQWISDLSPTCFVFLSCKTPSLSHLGISAHIFSPSW